MSNEFHRDYLVRLPLPLAQLYCRAHNAKDARARHDNCFYLFEAYVKLAGCPMVAAYVEERLQGSERVEALDRLLIQLALPSLGQWVGILRESARYFGNRDDADTHPLGHIWGQLNKKRNDLPGMLALYQRIKNGPEGKPAGDKRCSILQLIDALVQYRNAVFGHGASRTASFYEREMGPLMFPAVNDLLAEGSLDMLGPTGSRLVLLTEVKAREEEPAVVEFRELIGLNSERAAPLELQKNGIEYLTPDRLALIWPGRISPVPLDPLLSYDENEFAEDVLFLNRDRNGKQVEFLSYATGQAQRDKAMAPRMAEFLGLFTPEKKLSDERIEKMQDKTVAESDTAASAAAPPEAENDAEEDDLGDFEILSELGRGGMGVVYLARQRSLGRVVALKMLPKHLTQDEVALLRFRREMRALGRIEHPNVIKVITSGVMPNGELYYAMEYVPGADLERARLQTADAQRDVSVADLTGVAWTEAVLNASRQTLEETIDASLTSSPTRTTNPDRPVASGEETTPGPTPAPIPAPAEDDGPTPEQEAEAAALRETLTQFQATRAGLADLDPRRQHRGGYIRRIVEIMRDAALALEQVHQQGFVHRDVKPANLMLTADGERIVLMDFGLAKGEGEMSEASMSAGFVGTLRYAAPEQFSSAKDAVGPATDVRGLGVTLWELLTQKTLFAEAEDERQLSALVQDVDVPRLRSVDANFDRDLEAIVARATERRREDRIQSARDLAEYLTLYLDGKPIPIRTPGLTEMLMRWVRENKAIVATAAAASLLILVTVIAAFVLINQARLKEMAAKEQERAAKITAQENFEMARGAVEKYFTRVSENRLLNEPGMQALRNELLEDALAFNRRFIEQYRDDPRVQRDLAIAYFNLGRVVEDIGQSDEAIRQYESAREVQQRLRKAQPEDLQLVTQLALTWNAIGRSRQRASQLAAALKAYEEAAGLRERLVQGEPDNAEYHRLLANAHMNVGLIQFRRGKLDPAEAGIRKAQALRKQQLEARQLEVQEQRAIRRDYGMGWYNLANLKLNQDDVQAADSLVQQAIASFAQLHQQQPTEIMSQYRLAQCYRLLADTKDDLGEAIDAYAKAETHMAKLSSENPLLGSLAMELAQIRVELGNLHLEAEKLAVAAGHFEAAIEGLRKLRQKSPEFAPYAENLALALQGDGDRHIAQKQWASARARLQESLDLWQDLLKQRPGDSFYEENRDAAQKSLKALAGKKATALQ